MRTMLIAYAVTAVTFLALDFAWLGTMVNTLYRPRMGEMMLEKPIIGVAVAFYLIYVAGVVLFVVGPALRDGDWVRALWTGAAFGFVAYATYDMTNLATLRGWSPLITAVDLVWGSFVTAAAATVGTLVTGWLTRGS